MARIPTISASSITGLPGTAGGVKLTRTGVGAVPISTPLTQRLNPSQYGQEGAAMAELGAEIFNSTVLPAIELSRKNARAEQSMKQSKRLYDEMSAIKNELAKNVLPQSALSGLQGEHKEAAAWTKHWNGINSRIDQLLPSITANVSDKRHAVALSNAFMPQIMSLKLKSQNRQVQVSEDRTTHAFIETQKAHVAEIMKWMPKEATNGTYIFEGKKIEGELQRMELTATVFANSGVNPLDRQKIIEAARKNLVDEVAGTLQAKPEMGAEFLKKYGAKLGMTAGEIGETIYKMERFAEQHEKLKQKKEERKETEEENAAKATVYGTVKLEDGREVSMLTSLKIKALNGDLTGLEILTQHADLFDRAGLQTESTKLMTMVDGYDDTAGESKPKTLDNYRTKVSLMLGTPDLETETIDALLDEIFALKDMSKTHKNEMAKSLSVLKSVNLKDPDYELAVDFIKKQAPVPLDPDDNKPATLRSRAIWNTWMTEIEGLVRKNDPAAWRNFDFFGRAEEIVNTHSELYSNVSSDGAQKLIQESARKFGDALGNPDLLGLISVSKGDRIYLDADAMADQLQKRRSELNKDQIDRALAAITWSRNFSGQSAKVAEIKELARITLVQDKAKEAAALEEKLEREELIKSVTPDQLEDLIRREKPDWAEKLFGEDKPKTETKPETQKTETQPVPEPKKTSVTTDNRQTEMFQPTVTFEEIAEIGKRLNLDPGDLEELIQRGQQAVAQVDEEVTRLDTLAAEQEQLAAQSSEALEERQAEAAALSGPEAMWEEAKEIGLSPEILKNKDYFPDLFIFQKWSELLEREVTEEEKPIYQLLVDEVRRRGLSG